LVADSFLVEHDDSTGQNTSNRTQSPSDLSESSNKESSSRQFSSDVSSSEDEQDGGGGGHRKISAVTSAEWQQQIIAQNMKKKKRSENVTLALHNNYTFGARFESFLFQILSLSLILFIHHSARSTPNAFFFFFVQLVPLTIKHS